MDDRDPIDTVIKTALTADAATARRLAEVALTERGSSSRLVLALTGFAVIAAAAGVTRYAVGEPPVVIRGEGDTIVVESGPRLHRSIETFRDEQPRGGVVVIRKGGD